MNKYLTQILEISNKSKYAFTYIKLCESRLLRTIQTEYTEKHHMVPKSFKLGGEKDPENIIRFTYREHFIAHRLLSKMFRDKKMKGQMLKAIVAFYQNNEFQNRKPTSRHFAIMKMAARTSNILIQTGTKRSAETKLKQSLNNCAGRKEVKEKIANTKLSRYGNSGYCNPAKTKVSKLEKYGSETFVNIEKASQTKLEKYGSSTYNNWDKTKQTNLEKYGSSNKANMKMVCEHCGHPTIFSWYIRKHKDGKCITSNDCVLVSDASKIAFDPQGYYD